MKTFSISDIFLCQPCIIFYSNWDRLFGVIFSFFICTKSVISFVLLFKMHMGLVMRFFTILEVIRITKRNKFSPALFHTNHVSHIRHIYHDSPYFIPKTTTSAITKETILLLSSLLSLFSNILYHFSTKLIYQS